MPIVQAVLDGYSLPLQFSYKPATPVKRVSLVQGVNTVIRQRANTIVAADTLIAWECKACCDTDWKSIFDKFNQASEPDMAFTGYWGDSYVVKFHVLDPPSVRSMLFDLSGSFQIVTVTAWHS
jgi:hypothetical protein